MTSSITWSHIRIMSPKVIKSLQDKESHTNTQKLDQYIKKLLQDACGHLVVIAMTTPAHAIDLKVACVGLHTYQWVCTGIEVRRNVSEYWSNCRRSGVKRTVMLIWREGTAGSSKHKPENGTRWMRTVLAEWELYLQQFEIGWNASDRSYFFLFEIPPEHIIWEILCARVTLGMCTMLSEHVAKLHISLDTPAWIAPLPFTSILII